MVRTVGTQMEGPGGSQEAVGAIAWLLHCGFGELLHLLGLDSFLCQMGE